MIYWNFCCSAAHEAVVATDHTPTRGHVGCRPGSGTSRRHAIRSNFPDRRPAHLEGRAVRLGGLRIPPISDSGGVLVLTAKPKCPNNTVQSLSSHAATISAVAWAIRPKMK